MKDAHHIKYALPDKHGRSVCQHTLRYDGVFIGVQIHILTLRHPVPYEKSLVTIRY